jgi:hypothetical protein
VRGFSDAAVRTLLDPACSLAMWDQAAGNGVFWTPAVERVPWYERAAPLRAVLHWSLAGPTRHLVHGGAVGDEHAGVLVAGAGGSGKTSTALACLEAGMGYAGDDYILVDLEPQPTAIGLYGTAKIDEDGLARLPGLASARSSLDAEDRAKAVLDLGRHRPHLLRRAIPVAAIVLPRVRPGRTRLRPAGPAEALRALAPSTILQHSHESAGGLAVMAELVRRLPSFTLDLGDDLTAVPQAIMELFEARP